MFVLMRRSKRYKYKGQLLSVSEIMECEEVTLSSKAIYNRINKASLRENESITEILSKPESIENKTTVRKTKKYRFKNRLLSIKEIMQESDVMLSQKAIYNRIAKAGVVDGGSVTKLLKCDDLRLKSVTGRSDIHSQRNKLHRLKESLGLTWDELADKFDMKPRTFANYRYPSTSPEFRQLKEKHYHIIKALETVDY